MRKAPFCAMLLFGLCLLLLPQGRINGCGYYFLLDEYRLALFNPLLVDDPAMRSFQLYFDVPFVYTPADPELKDYQRNCREWARYLGEGVQEQDVLKVLYRSSPDDFLVAMEDHRLDSLYPGNTFIQKLLQPTHTEALNYLNLAMRAEFAHFSSNDPWGLDESYYDFFQKITPVIKTARAKLNTLKDPFLIERYAYQLVVQYRYTETADECIRYCEDYFDLEQSSSILAPWANFYMAEVMATQESQVEKAHYILSQVFDLCESKKNRIYQLIEPETLKTAIRHAQNDRERAHIHALLALKSPGPEYPNLEKIAQLDPESRYLPQLLLREINKIEHWLLTPKVTFFGGEIDYEEEQDRNEYMPGESYGLLQKEIPYLQKNLEKDLAYLRKIQQLLRSLLQDTRYTQRDFAHLALAHLYALDQQPAKAAMHLDKIVDKTNAQIQLQKNIIRLLILPDQVDIRSAEAKEEIVRAFRRVQAQIDLFSPKLRVYPKLLLYYSRLFQKKGDVPTAGLFYNRSQIVPTNGYMAASPYYGSISYFDRFASTTDLDELIALAQSSQLNAFHTFLTEPLSPVERTSHMYSYDDIPTVQENGVLHSVLPSLEQLYDLKGTIAFRQHRLEVALAAFEHLPKTYWKDTYSFASYLNHDPFSVTQKFAWQGEKWPMYSKAEVVRRMISLQKEADQPGPRQAEACYLLANAYWNTSFWGRSWMMFSYGQSMSEYIRDSPGWVAHENFSFQPNAESYFEVYYKMSRAIDYYQKTLKSKPDEELAARATYMLGYCDKYAKLVDKNEIELDIYDDPKDKEPYISPVFYTFRSQFGHTAAYRDCVNNCPELADYFKE